MLLGLRTFYPDLLLLHRLWEIANMLLLVISFSVERVK